MLAIWCCWAGVQPAAADRVTPTPVIRKLAVRGVWSFLRVTRKLGLPHHLKHGNMNEYSSPAAVVRTMQCCSRCPYWHIVVLFLLWSDGCSWPLATSCAYTWHVGGGEGVLEGLGSHEVPVFQHITTGDGEPATPYSCQCMRKLTCMYRSSPATLPHDVAGQDQHVVRAAYDCVPILAITKCYALG